MAPERGRVTGIGGVFLKAEDPPALLAWYRKALGIETGETSYTTFEWRDAKDPERVGSTTWSLFEADTDYFGPEDQRAMVNYRVDDLDAALERLRDAGADVDERIEEYEYGRFGWASDPEGNRFELWEPPTGR
ncbi:MAG: VOC family protein [Gemmatimonadota bacterium]|nr:VOC family protein [Gemmatimonadota bacterium]